MEPTVNGTTEDAEGTPSITLSIVNGDQRELRPGDTGQEDPQDKSILDHTKGKLDDEEDEGVAQNSSIDDGESVQSSSETEKQGHKPASREGTQTKDIKTKGTEELLTANAPVDQNRKLSPREASGVHGNLSPKGQSPDGSGSGAELSEEERRKKSYEAEMKSWLLERMQAPIKGMILAGY